MELWDLYNYDRQKIGKTHIRGVPIPDNCYHLVVRIWIQNDKGELLLSKRQPNKTYGGLWECTGGSVLTDENSLEGALRETWEELGLKLEPAEGKLLCSGIHDKSHWDHWLFTSNTTLDGLWFQDGEVIDAKWADRETYEKMLQNKEIVPTLSYFFDLIMA